MESALNFFIFLLVIISSVYLTYHSKDSSSSNRFNDILSFGLPFISTLVFGIVGINKLIYLPVVITVALITGFLSLLINWRAELRLSSGLNH